MNAILEHAACGNGCSGNPFDMDWTIIPIGWGESHELGHNMQMSLLQISYTAEGVDTNIWTSYQNRATENSNNIFPYHGKWFYYRIFKEFNGTIPDGWSFIDSFSILQSALADVNATVSGVNKRVSLSKGTCSVKNSFDLQTTATRVSNSLLDGECACEFKHV